VSDPPPGPDLQKHYEQVLAEYRFQVLLNWDRAKHYLIFNTAIFGAAAALYKGATSWASEAAVAALLLIATLNSFAGQLAVALGQQYYRNIRDTKTALERDLGLEQYAIVSTPGMGRAHGVKAAGTPEVGRCRLRKITTQIRILLGAIGVFAALGAAYAVHASYETFSAPQSPVFPSHEPP
jgi:hypothetical protein